MESAGKCPTIARGGGWALLELTDALDTQTATKSDVFGNYFVYSVFIPRVTFLVELQIQLYTPMKSNMNTILLKINLLDEISIQLRLLHWNTFFFG